MSQGVKGYFIASVAVFGIQPQVRNHAVKTGGDSLHLASARCSEQVFALIGVLLEHGGYVRRDVDGVAPTAFAGDVQDVRPGIQILAAQAKNFRRAQSCFQGQESHVPQAQAPFFHGFQKIPRFFWRQEAQVFVLHPGHLPGSASFCRQGIGSDPQARCDGAVDGTPQECEGVVDGLRG